MGKPYMLLACVLLAGCEKPMIAGCEDYIRSTLKSPTSYKRMEVFENEAPITPEELKQSGSIGWRFGVAPEKTVHTVLVKYEAANAFGVSIGGGAVCAFNLGENPSSTLVRSAVSNARLRSDRRAMIESGLLRNDGETPMDPGYPCCLQ